MAHKPPRSLGNTNLIVFNGLGQRLHVDRLVQLVFVQQIDEEIQGSLVDAHLRVQRADLLVDLHAALSQRSERKREAENMGTQMRFGVRHKLGHLLFVFMQRGLQESQRVNQTAGEAQLLPHSSLQPRPLRAGFIQLELLLSLLAD